MTGLLDFNPNIGLLGGLLEDPNARLALAAQLMQARKGEFFPALGQGLLSAQAARQGAESRKLMEDLRRQQYEAGQLDLARRRREAQRQEQFQQLAGQFTRPGAAPSLTPYDDEGNPMPSTRPSFDYSGYASAIAPFDPGQSLALQSQLAQMGQRNVKAVNRNERLVDMTGGNPRVMLEAAPDLPPGMRIGASGQPEYIPGYIEGQGAIRAAGRQTTNVNLPAPERAFNVEMAKLDAKQIDEWRDAAVKAQGGLSRIGEMKRLAQEGVYSGWGASGRAEVANFFDTLGVGFDRRKLANSQEYMKHAKELTLAMLKEGVGSTQISNADREFVEATVPQLETNPRARLDLLNYMERRLGDSVERFQSADAYARERGGLNGFQHRPREPERQQRPQKLQRNQTAIWKAQQAIKSGKNREAVIQRLIDEGFDPSGL